MDQVLLDQVNNYYNQIEESNFLKFKSEIKDKKIITQYLNFYQKCNQILSSVESTNMDQIVYKLQNSIIQITSRLNDVTKSLKDCEFSKIKNDTELKLKKDDELYENYKKDSEKIVEVLTENLSKIRQGTYAKEHELLSDIKKENNSKKNELNLQQLKNTLAENLKTYRYCLKDKNSKLTSIEEKKNTLNDNKLKTEKLKAEFNSNSERMKIEMANNENFQKEIDDLVVQLNNLNKEKNYELKETEIQSRKNEIDKISEQNEKKLKILYKKYSDCCLEIEKFAKKLGGSFLIVSKILNDIYKVNKMSDIRRNTNSINLYINYLNDLSKKVSVKSEKLEKETDEIDRRYLKYQMILNSA